MNKLEKHSYILMQSSKLLLSKNLIRDLPINAF